LNSLSRNLVFWVIIVLVMVLLFNFFNKPRQTVLDKNYSEFITAVETERVHEVETQGRNILWKDIEGKSYRTYAPEDPEMIKLLREKRVVIQAKKEGESPLWQILLNWFPMLLLIGVWLFFMRQVQMGGGKALSFGKSKAKILTKEHNRVTFENVAGIEEARAELEEIIAFLRDPKKFTKLGGRIPKGVLLIGAPGTGKTLLARAIAGEADVPFFTISGSDFVEMFVGVGASRVRDLFLQGKRNAPCIIFIDEIDAVGRHRGAGLGGGHDEREQTLNQLLVEMDGFESNEGVILIAATNRPDVLDPALLRPGRFDRQVVVPIPDIKGREEILRVHTKKTPLSENVSLAVLARGTPGFTGADLENLVNEGALLAARLNKEKIEMVDLDQAKDKVLMGAERRSMIIPLEERKNTAYHEAGHTLVAKMIPNTDPIHKVTIIPRGRAMGLTQQLPIDEKHNYTKEYLLNNITIMMGGRAAEELILHHLTTGAGNDIERSTEIARKMVCEWGMSDRIGPLACGQKEEQIFLGKEFGHRRDYSEETARLIDGEIRAIVTRAYESAKNIVQSHMDKLHHLATALLDKEVLDGQQIDQILREEAA
jgi:cell division protease FtsH